MSLKKGIPEIVAKKMSFNPTIVIQYLSYFVRFAKNLFVCTKIQLEFNLIELLLSPKHEN